jgi:tetratricopeptide (TPR) repeat protein
MSNPTRDQVFISYSHADRRWLKKLQTMLEPLVSKGKVTAWDDTVIKPGQRWKDKIERALASARVAVLLVSDNFLASDFIARHELPQLLNAAQEEGVQILWVALSYCLYEETEISDYQAANDPARPLDTLRTPEQRQALADISRQIKEAVMAQVDGDPPQEEVAHKETPISLPLKPGDINRTRLMDISRKLFGREHEFDILDAAWANPDINIVSLVAWGGVGKSALVSHWLHRMAQENYRGAEKVYAWSFYKQGTSGHGVSADEFIAHALDWFDDTRPGEGSQWGKGERLANLVGKQRTLLVLDGLEPLQEPPRSGVQAGRLKEDSMRALLGGLATINPGLCVITSRLSIRDLTGCERYTVRRIDLEHLSPEAGAELLKAEKVEGESEELKLASREFGGHALALTLLGGYLRDVCGRQVARRKEVDILEQDEEDGGHAQRVMASYERWFSGHPALAVLRIIALFDRPADGPAIAALRKKSDIPHLTEPLKNLSEEDWQRAIARLRDAKLIADKDPNQPETLDAHPLVREYFKKQLRQNDSDAWSAGNDQLFNYLRKAVKGRPDTIQDMAFLYAAIPHGCQADRYERAFREIYFVRIQQGQKFFAPSKLGTVSADLEALSCFFDPPWEHPSDPPWKHPVASITGKWRALLFGQAGYRLWMLGRLKEAITPIEEALEADVTRAKEALDADVAREAWKYASVDAETLASIYLSLGDLTKALSYSKDGVEYALDSGDSDQLVSALSTQGDVLHHKGDLPESQEVFEHAKGIKGAGRQIFLFPHSLGHRRHDLLLSLGRYGEVQDTVKRILESQGAEDFNLIDSALLYLSLGQAYLFESPHMVIEAKANLELAMDYLRRAGRVVHIPRGRLALADLHIMTGELNEAKTNLDEALATATRNDTELHQADCHLKYAWLYLEQGENEKARESWAKAKEIIDRRGYHLRDVDSHLLAARLHIARGEKGKAQESLAIATDMIERMGYHRLDKYIKDIEGQIRSL